MTDQVSSGRGCWVVLAAAGLALAGCSSSTSSDETPAGPVPGTITLTFANETADDIYIDTTWRAWSLWQGSTGIRTSYDCTTPCSSGCSCAQCGPPQSQVRRIAAGSSYEATWAGVYYEVISCGAEPYCSCAEQHYSDFGEHEATMSGAKGYIAYDPDPPSGDSFAGELDPASEQCAAAVTFTLDAEPHAVTASFDCS